MSVLNFPRVLHVSTPRSWRGGEQQLAYLLEELKQQQWGPVIMCRAHSPMRGFCHKHNIESFSFSRRGLNNMLLGWEIYRLCLKRKFDIIHAHDPHAHAAAIFASDLGNAVPIVVSRRVDFPVRNSWFSRRKYNHPSIKAIVCVSQAIKGIMAPAINNRDVLSVIHSGIDPSRFNVDVPHGRLRKEYAIPPGNILIGNVAALAPHKDYPTFLNAARLLLEKNPSLSFLAIGEGPERARVEQLIVEMGLEKHVHITGFRNDIPEVLPQLDLMMFTSSTEGLGTTVLDAFACGVPVVTTAAGGIPEMVEHRISGMLAPVKDAGKIAENVLELLADPLLRQRIIEGGFEKLKHFNRSNTASKTMKLYQHLTDNQTAS